MSIELLELRALDLLERFGDGEHKPGSGSAAALNGMLACQLVITVAKLTVNRDSYQRVTKRAEQIRLRIEKSLEPSLRRMFGEDSIEFGKVFAARQFRDQVSKGSRIWWDRERAHLSHLKSATDLPLEIARSCLAVCRIAVEVFDIGYRCARGDTCVALSSALSGAKGALSIIYLNLRSFRANDWPDWQEQMRTIARGLQREIDILEGELQIRSACLENRTSNAEIDERARDLQLKLFHRREVRGPVDVVQAVRLLDPRSALALYGFECREIEALGEIETWNGRAKVAGLVDMPNKVVFVSPDLDAKVRKFTTAHELGHVVLHDFAIPHRDRELDGSAVAHRNDFERQADRFASCFLMPKKTTISLFQEFFRQERFELSESTAFALGMKNEQLRAACSSDRVLSRLLANTTSFDGRNFDSLSNVFGVSAEAMAIRLEDLKLIEPLESVPK